MFFSKKIKSISPLIATILLIVVSVILITVVLTWGSDFARDKLSTAKNKSNQNTDLTGLISSRSISSQNILISNNSSKDLNITGYKIISSIDHYLYSYFENKIYNLDEPLIINPNSAQTLQIDCYPENSFFIDLITDQNTYVRTQISARSINYVDSLKCRLILDYDVTLGSQIERTGKTLTLTGVESTNIVKNINFYEQIMNGGYKLTTSSNIITANSITIVFWANYNDISLGTYILDNGTFFIDGSTSNRIRIRSDGSTSALSNENYVVPTTTQFFAITRDTSGFVDFYSGTSSNAPTINHTNQISGTPLDTDQLTTIFGISSSNSIGFRGKMMIFKIYADKLSLDEITQVWNNTKHLID